MARRKETILDGKRFKSVFAAAKHFGMSYQYFNKVLNHDPKALEIIISNYNNKKNGKAISSNPSVACGVTCSNGKTFATIKDAAKYAGAKMWTMSLKMEATGKFVDKDGNEYYRNTPMRKRTGREYFCKTSTVRGIKDYTRNQVNKNAITQIATKAVNVHNSSVLTELATQAKAQIDAGNYNMAIKLCDAMSVLRQLIK